MKNYQLTAENAVRMLDSGAVSATGETFQNEEGLRKITSDWPLSRLVEVWNRVPGVKAVKKFTDRKTACGRIWKAVQQREAAVGAKGRNVAAKAKGSRKKATSSKEAATGRPGGKKAKILALVEKPDGATLKDLMAATGWQAHSVRGYISGILGKKMGLKVDSVKREDGERTYRVVGR